MRRDAVFATGTLQLAEKIKTLRSRPDITFSDFGTRRRFSRSWQEYVVRVLAQEMPGQMLGTSNTAMAMQYGLLPIGTLAHEIYMVLAGVMAQSDRHHPRLAQPCAAGMVAGVRLGPIHCPD